MSVTRTWMSFTILLAACASESPTAAIDQYIESLPYLPVDPAQVVQGSASQPQRDGDYSCTTENLQETRQFDRIIAYAANSDSLWPGAVVSADSVVSGLFTQIVLPRAPQTISVSLENLDGSKQAAIPSPTLASYRDALAGILDSQITGATAANLYSEIEQVHSQDQLNLALGVNASWGLGIASLKSSFDFSNTQIRSRYIVRYMQTYYTVDLDAPSTPGQLFAPSVTLGDVKGKMDETRPPVYVSSVTYGRMVLFTFESQYSDEELGAALQFAYAGGADVSGDVSVTYKEILSQSKITAFILGGDAGSAVQTIDSYDNLIAFIKQGGNYSKDSPGAPIAYKLAYLKDNSPARMSFTTQYEQHDCVRVAQKVKVTLRQIAVDSGGDQNTYGTVDASGTTSTSLFSKDGSNAVKITQGSAFGSTNTPVGEGVIEVVPQPGQAIQLHAHLKGTGFFSDHDLGDETVSEPFETGWRKTATVTLTGSGAQVRLVFDLVPI
ncbi:MAG: thiol-activated cytolysin family protein [Acidobacteriota bacterium]